MAAQSPQPPETIAGMSHSEMVLRREIWQRLNRDNEHFMGVVVGREGSGKSLTAVAIAALVDPEFTADDVFFDPQDLLKAFDSDEYGPGNMIIMDEAGVGLGNRSWYDKEQILLNQTLQTVRDDNMGVIFTLPRLEELDSQTIGRLHAMIQMEGVVDGNYATAKWKNIELSRDGRGNDYQKYPRYMVDGSTRRISQIAIARPPASIEENYEQRKEAFKSELYEDAIDAYEPEDEGDDFGPQEAAEHVVEQDRVQEFVSEHGQNGKRFVDGDLLGAEFNLSVRKAKTAKKLIEKEIDL